VYQARPEVAGHGNWGIDYHDGYAYLSTGYAGFEIVDVSDPANPVFAGTSAEPWPEGVQAADLKFNPALGDILHVGTQPGAFLVNFDVSDPANVVDVSSVPLGGGQLSGEHVEIDLACVYAAGAAMPFDPSPHERRGRPGGRENPSACAQPLRTHFESRQGPSGRVGGLRVAVSSLRKPLTR
jgi:hypothetical protein